MIRNKYNTKQKDLILDIIKKMNKEFTINDIYKKLNRSVGLTTIYRLVDSLIKDGLLHKDINNNNVTYYQYLEQCDEENHFYLKCDNCGKIIHIDCECINELSNHILKHHKFITNKEQIIINGICNNCIKGGN